MSAKSARGDFDTFLGGPIQLKKSTDLFSSLDVPVTSIQELMGHRWLESTQAYIKANDKQAQADYYAACQKIEGWPLSPVEGRLW
jgi:hypothetical protein